MKPILFNTENVRALLEGRKTVTRRLVKPLPKGAHDVIDYDEEEHTVDLLCGNNGEGGAFLDWAETVKAPFWTGDILYVRETFRIDYLSNIPGAGRVQYKDGTYMDIRFAPERYDMMRRAQRKPGWRPNENMPREAARIFLRVTDVRVERLQEISEDGATDEGCRKWCEGSDLEVPARSYFCNLWDSTIKPKDLDAYGWEANPWVFAISFKRITKNEAMQ